MTEQQHENVEEVEVADSTVEEVAEAETLENAEAVEEAVDEIAELKAQLADAEEKLLRNQAEAQNMKARLAKEQAQSLKYANQKLATDILPALDNLERALQVETNDEAAQQIKTGVDMVLKTLVDTMAAHEIVAVGEVGGEFDPNQHQAIQSVPADDDHPADTIAQVMQKGYVLKDRVIRPAMVAVYS
ncbi:nucleotide exchange factor GrpE [Weissella ceti]|uniref:Protein GrpE n=1 Tax=Weissella ceti TaxID=759620 RepID=A0ABT3E3R6_9LACO|nr:nucleotide exchange factor GrpE [Weissella ceti]MCW0953060.1 nucleotide exchange factor GrpE [Weissella ceti]QVK11603.1 nucleotide exchange factor GrpE [Weissella ceti]